MFMLRFKKSLLILFVVLLSCQSGNKISSISDGEGERSGREKIFLRKEGTFRYGETLEQVLSRDIFDRVMTSDIVASFSQVFDVRRIRGDSRYSILTDSLGTVHGFEYYPSTDRTIRVLRDSSGVLQPEILQVPLMMREQGICGYVRTSLYDAVKSMGHSDELIVAFSDVFQWDIDFFVDPRVGDEFRILFESIHALDPAKADSVGDFVRYGRVLGGQYLGAGGEYTAVWFEKDDKVRGYYDLQGRSFQKTFLKSPLNYRRISSHFSGGRRHPILKIVRPHYGVDFAAAAGTPVSAAADGVVIEKGYDGGIGNFVKIRHKNPRFVTLYGHLSRFGEGIAAGAAVRQRDVIGYVGSTGLATGPHLHYMFYENGRPINPLKIKNSSGDPILPSDQAAFDSLKEVRVRQLLSLRPRFQRMPEYSLFSGRLRVGAQYLPQR